MKATLTLLFLEKIQGNKFSLLRLKIGRQEDWSESRRKNSDFRNSASFCLIKETLEVLYQRMFSARNQLSKTGGETVCVNKNLINPLFAVYCKNTWTRLQFTLRILLLPQNFQRQTKIWLKESVLNLWEMTGPVMTSQRAQIQKL